MKSVRLLAVALLACACTTSAAIACDAHKSGKSSSASAATAAKVAPAAPAGTAAVPATYAKGAAHPGCTAEMAAACTPAMRAACQSNAAVAAAMGCETKGTSAAVAADTRPAKSAKAGGDCCAMKGASAAVAANTKLTANDQCAPGKASSAAVAGMKGAGHDCSACADWTTCEQDVQALGARAQVVALKNGAMIVYTTESPADVKALQATVAKRHERMLAALAAGGNQKLCPECKALRGAIASGKLHREVVNVERGCMTLLTSNDASVVTKIRAMTGQPVAMR
jgi:hypothetical protein